MTSQRRCRRYWRLDSIDAGECIYGEFHNERFAPHFHDTFSFGLVARGVNLFDFRGKLIEAGPETACIVGPGEVHTGGGGDHPWAYWNVQVPLHSLMREARASGLHRLPEFAGPTTRDPEVVAALAAFFRLLGGGGGQSLACETAFSTAIGLLLRSADGVPARTAGRDLPLARRTIEYLNDRWRDDIRLADIEAATGANRYRLIRAVQALSGLSPFAYLMQVRAQRAKKLILAGAPLAEAAAEARFTDQAHMTKVFKRLWGITPGAMARSIGK